jgi:hypothetical protein
MVKKYWKRGPIIFLTVVVVVMGTYGLLTMNEKRGPIENTGAIHKLAPDTEPGNLGN